ncbi:hypothetical protein [Rhodococcus sp. NPDC056516]|uniref:hypothetical protein n=1 Tax=Rhodococcus sp. NPDC056516 TaxID=3345847 RepID=UPI003670CC4B
MTFSDDGQHSATRSHFPSVRISPQPIRGHRWLWNGPILVIAAIVAHLTGTDWSAWTGGEIVALLALGVCVGLAEELITRGQINEKQPSTAPA